MRIWIEEYTMATKTVAELRDFYGKVLGESAAVEDHEFFYKLRDKENRGCLAVVPHNGDAKWDSPWVILGTDDLPAAITYLKEMGVDSIENSGPTDDDGNPVACITFRDPEGRLIMMAC